MIRIATVCLMAYWLALFCATHLPSSALPSMRGSDKLYHFAAFAGLAFLLAWALPTRARWGRHLAIAGFVAVVYAAVDELTQHFIPGRACELNDFLADSAGIATGLAAYTITRLLLAQHRWGRRLIEGLSR